MLELARPDLVVRADTLVFTLTEPALDPQAARFRRIAGTDVEMRLTGTGHQLLAGPLVETVAGLEGREGPLPYEIHTEIGGWSYGFTADVYRRDYADFHRGVAFLRRYLTGRDDALAASYPGEEDTLCGVLVRQVRRGLEWRGWHTFPETRQIVATRSRMLVS